MKVKGVNLGNWLVLEKWMSPALFAGTTAEDEYYLPRQLSKEVYEARIKIHRSEYITERDFVTIKSMGMEAVRIPVPYFIFGDREPFIGCIEELDKAFNWAEAYGLQILIDLHTAPLGQNGFDNGGICGVCKWSKHPEEVEFVLSVLERLAERYGERKGLWGIEVINEPVTENMWETMKVPERYPAVDPELAEGSGPVTLDFLRGFYKDAYDRIRKYMPEEKYVVIHDGFELKAWKGYMQEEKYKNVSPGYPSVSDGCRGKWLRADNGRISEVYQRTFSERYSGNGRIFPGDLRRMVPVQFSGLWMGYQRRTVRIEWSGRGSGKLRK